ncbi:MAG: HAD family hydrolase, partial [Thermoleophilia bacterium]
MIQAVVSDFGGVLTSPLLEAFDRVQDRIDVRPEMYRDAMAYCLRHDGVHPLFAVERGEISEREFLTRVERGLAETAGVRVSLHGFGEQLMSAMGPNWELFDHYRSLRRERSLRFALCTNNVREWEARWRALLPIDELFEVVVDSAFVGMRKPEPEIYALTLDRLGDVRAEECLFVDDLDVNCEAAREAGMHAVRFEDNQQAIPEITRMLD